MKKHSFDLDEILVDEFFKPIRCKRDVVKLLMKTIKVMLVNIPVNPIRCKGKVTLVVDKMSRLFYITENKIFSISFPFSVQEVDGGLEFYSNFVKIVDSKVTSDVIGIISQDTLFSNDCVYEFFEPVIEVADFEQSFWPFLLMLFMFEDGYIRYDCDAKHVNGDFHPLNHYDVFYTSLSTFKIGLRRDLAEDVILDLLNLNSACHYIEF